jgi:peptide/nickel transport system permease protein
MSSLPVSTGLSDSKLASAAPAALEESRSAARFWRLKSFARDRGALLSGLFLLAVLLAVVFAPLIAHYGPDEADNLARYKPIGTAGHILGTDQQGRDMLARLLFGGRVSLGRSDWRSGSPLALYVAWSTKS